MNLNKIFIIGRLTRDPEVKATAGGKSVANMSVATSERWTDAAGAKQEKTAFHRVVIWGKLADLCGQYLVKGQMVTVIGRMEYREWETADKQKRTAAEIVAEDVQFGPKPGGSANPTVQEAVAKGLESVPPEIKVEDIPF